MNYLSIDPGETTAYIKATHTTGPKGRLTIGSHGTWASLREFIHLEGEGLFSGIDAVILEDYRVYASKVYQHIGSQVHTIRVIGWVQHAIGYYCMNPYLEAEDPPLIKIHYQMAQQAKGAWPNRRLFRHLPPARNLNRHERDALRHLLVYLETHNLMRFFKPEEVI
jgi:hypothetical protein